MPVSYRYKRVEPWDAPYVWRLIERDIAVSVLGITETAEEFILFFEKELTPDQKAKLDALMAKPPTPTAVYEFGAIDLEDEIAMAVGVRPVRVDFDEATGRGRIYFDTTLTPTQEKALETFMKALRGGFLKRRS